MVVLQYDFIYANSEGITQHPQKQMQELGYEVLNYEADSMADFALITVAEVKEPLPEYLRLSPIKSFY